MNSKNMPVKGGCASGAKKVFFTLILLLTLLFFNTNFALAYTWGPPTGNPPTNNTYPPIDISSNNQIKAGGLEIQGTLTVTDIQGSPTATGSSGASFTGETTGNTGSDIGIKGVATNPINAWAGYFFGPVGVSGSIYVSGLLSVGIPSPTAKFSIAGGDGSSTMIFVDAPSTYSGKLIDLQVASSSKFSVNKNGAVTIGGAYTLPTADGSPNYVLKTNGSGTVTWQADSTGSGGYSLPTEIKETGVFNNADFSSFGTNGWNGIKAFAETNCGAEYHVCYAWELPYIYMEGLPTAGCSKNTGLPGDNGIDVCLGWVAGAVTETSGSVYTGDCDGYQMSLSNYDHGSVWYSNQWAPLPCSTNLPVLCCK